MKAVDAYVKAGKKITHKDSSLYSVYAQIEKDKKSRRLTMDEHRFTSFKKSGWTISGKGRKRSLVSPDGSKSMGIESPIVHKGYPRITVEDYLAHSKRVKTKMKDKRLQKKSL